MLYTLVILLLVGLDQLSKHLVRLYIPMYTKVDFIPHILGLNHIHNTGAAFSMLSGARWFFVVLTVVFVIVAMYVLIVKKPFHPMGSWSMVLVIGGAIGNLIDRALCGYVVDMFEVLFMDFAIFNVADIFVVVGGIAFCVYYGFLHDKLMGKEQKYDDSV